MNAAPHSGFGSILIMLIWIGAAAPLWIASERESFPNPGMWRHISLIYPVAMPPQSLELRWLNPVGQV
jgi:hypothetical protein